MTINWLPEIQKDGSPLYLAITKALAEDISSGKLRSDTRLPTHRELADSLKVAIGTVTRAYTEAERRGLIRSEGRRGTFVGESKKEKSSLSRIIESGGQVIDLSKNHPTAENDPVLAQALKKIARESRSQKYLQYSASQGEHEHRVVGARWLARMGMAVDPDSIVITCGAQHALMIIFAVLTQTGDVIVTDSYTYPGVKAIAELFGLQLFGIAGDKEGLLPEAFETICRQKSVRAIYCNPTLQNPTNIIMSQARRQEIASIAERHDVIIVEDEILRPLVEKPPPFMSAFAPERSFVVMSVSKVIAAGLRVGYIVAPARLKRKIIDSLQTSMLSAPSLTVRILSGWLEDGTADKVILKRRQELTARQQVAQKIIGNYMLNAFPSSYHIWLQLPENWTSMGFTIEALRRGVAVTAAEIFAVDRHVSVKAVRVSVGPAPNRETLKAGLEIVASILEGSVQLDQATV
jgi:DNA-binding transcriptional MocR family regulator